MKQLLYNYLNYKPTKEQTPSIKNPNTYNIDNNVDIKARRKCNLKNKLQSYKICPMPLLTNYFPVTFFVIFRKVKLISNFQISENSKTVKLYLSLS